jgi:hypothetical protein
MGWAPWNSFFGSIDSSVIEQQTDSLVSSGMAAAGYKYVNLDDGQVPEGHPDVAALRAHLPAGERRQVTALAVHRANGRLDEAHRWPSVSRSLRPPPGRTEAVIAGVRSGPCLDAYDAGTQVSGCGTATAGPSSGGTSDTAGPVRFVDGSSRSAGPRAALRLDPVVVTRIPRQR